MSLRYKFRDRRAMGIRVGSNEFVQRAGVLDQASPPPFDYMKLAGRRSLAFPARFDGDANRFGVDFAHQLADQLFLSIEPAVFGDATRQHDGILEILGEG